MKFGQNLPRNQVPEWASSYIDYKTLKKSIKNAQKDIEAGEEPDLAGISGLTTIQRPYSDMHRLLPHPRSSARRRRHVLQS